MGGGEKGEREEKKEKSLCCGGKSDEWTAMARAGWVLRKG